MSSQDDPGARTSAAGTPFPVAVSRDRRVWMTFAMFLAGPVIWSVHFLLVYLVVEAGCSGGGSGLRLFDPPVPTIATLVATAAAALACLASARWGYRRWRASQHQAAGQADDLGGADLGGSLAFAGFLLSLLGLVTVLLVGLPALVLPAC